MTNGASSGGYDNKKPTPPPRSPPRPYRPTRPKTDITTARPFADDFSGFPVASAELGPLLRMDCLRRTYDRRIFRRMPRVQVYLPDELYDELKRRDLPASELLQVAVRAELERRQVLDATEHYLAELQADVGDPTNRHQTRAEAIVRRVRDRQRDQAV